MVAARSTGVSVEKQFILALALIQCHYQEKKNVSAE